MQCGVDLALLLVHCTKKTFMDSGYALFFLQKLLFLSRNFTTKRWAFKEDLERNLENLVEASKSFVAETTDTAVAVQSVP